jgi:hypothetical protein
MQFRIVDLSASAIGLVSLILDQHRAYWRRRKPCLRGKKKQTLRHRAHQNQTRTAIRQWIDSSRRARSDASRVVCHRCRRRDRRRGSCRDRRRCRRDDDDDDDCLYGRCRGRCRCCYGSGGRQRRRRRRDVDDDATHARARGVVRRRRGVAWLRRARVSRRLVRVRVHVPRPFARAPGVAQSRPRAAPCAPPTAFAPPPSFVVVPNRGRIHFSDEERTKTRTITNRHVQLGQMRRQRRTLSHRCRTRLRRVRSPPLWRERPHATTF